MPEDLNAMSPVAVDEPQSSPPPGEPAADSAPAPVSEGVIAPPALPPAAIAEDSSVGEGAEQPLVESAMAPVAAMVSAPAESPVGELPPEPVENKKKWYVVKVQSGREDTIKEALEKRMRKDGLEEFVGQIVIPVEKVSEIKQDPKTGKRVTKSRERKLYPGYLMVEVEYNDRVLYLFRETSGVGDFVGAHPHDLTKPPTPMSDKEVLKMLGGPKGEQDTPPIPPPPKEFGVGERVRVIDGTFNGMEGNIKQILDAVGKVQVELTIFGRPVAVDLEYYQVEVA